MENIINKKSKEYKQGFLDGYEKAFKDFERIKKQVDKDFLPLKNAIKKLKDFTL